MSVRELLKAGLILLGVFLIVESLARVVSASAFRPLLVGTSGRQVSELLRSAAFSLAVAIGGAVVFGVLPGMFIVLRADAWATRAFPESAAVEELTPAMALGLGSILVGIYFVVEGAAGVVGGGGLFLAGLANGEARVQQEGVRSSLSALVYLVAGGLAYRWGSRVVTRLA